MTTKHSEGSDNPTAQRDRGAERLIVLEAEIAELKIQVVESERKLTEERAELEKQIQQAEERRARVVEENQRLQSRIQAMENSRSWRATAIFRALSPGKKSPR
jgi:uncharacterized protein YqfA (UPF0365 family)